jgi:hypothetical protein
MKMFFRATIQHSLLASVLVIALALGLSPTAFAAATTNPKLAPCAFIGSNPPHPTKTETIGFKTVKQNDATLLSGQTKTIQMGHTGKRLVTYTASYKKNKLTGCKHTGTKVTVSPQNTSQSVGTYIAPAPTPAPTQSLSCTNGTYVNSAGNTVCSPETALSAPAGATAQCSDGTYSFSQSRSGTCSHHGGVGSWL